MQVELMRYSKSYRVYHREKGGIRRVPTSAQLRAQARESLSGNWTSAVLHFLLFYVIMFVIGLLQYIPIFGWLASIVVSGALTYGLFNFYLLISRREQPTTEFLFSGFGRFWKTLLLHLLMGIFVFLWTLLLFVPGIIAYFRYSQAYYILRDNPEISPMEAIRRSKAMMVGNKGRLFVLLLTFLGWSLLALLTCGIGFLWVAPYLYTAMGHFHNDLLYRNMPIPPPPSPYENAKF
jgi:uncharacterized membrane protein